MVLSTDRIRYSGVLLAIIIALLVLPPIWFLVQGSLYTTNADFTRGELTLDYYHRLIQEPRLFTSSLNSTVFAVGSSVVALLRPTRSCSIDGLCKLTYMAYRTHFGDFLTLLRHHRYVSFRLAERRGM